MPEYPYVNGICEGCDRLNSGYYNDPLSIAHHLELVQMVKELRAENKDLKAQLRMLTESIAHQIEADAGNETA